MKILSHRGYWKSETERNTMVAFQRSFQMGFGTETDIRDYCGQLVISHDVGCGNEMSMDVFLDIFLQSMNPRNLVLALNIKSDGLQELFVDIADRRLRSLGVDWFTFDMSVPDMRSYLKRGLPVFTRMSEVEKDPIWLGASRGVWLDAFESNWFSSDIIRDLVANGKKVCVVSSELHGRDFSELWSMLKSFSRNDSVMLCTDLPQSAKSFFA